MGTLFGIHTTLSDVLLNIWVVSISIKGLISKVLRLAKVSTIMIKLLIKFSPLESVSESNMFRNRRSSCLEVST